MRKIDFLDEWSDLLGSLGEVIDNNGAPRFENLEDVLAFIDVQNSDVVAVDGMSGNGKGHLVAELRGRYPQSSLIEADRFLYTENTPEPFKNRNDITIRRSNIWNGFINYKTVEHTIQLLLEASDEINGNEDLRAKMSKFRLSISAGLGEEHKFYDRRSGEVRTNDANQLRFQVPGEGSPIIVDGTGSSCLKKKRGGRSVSSIGVLAPPHLVLLNACWRDRDKGKLDEAGKRVEFRCAETALLMPQLALNLSRFDSKDCVYLNTDFYERRRQDFVNDRAFAAQILSTLDASADEGVMALPPETEEQLYSRMKLKRDVRDRLEFHVRNLLER